MWLMRKVEGEVLASTYILYSAQTKVNDIHNLLHNTKVIPYIRENFRL